MSVNTFTHSHLDGPAILEGSFDSSNNALRINLLNGAVPANWDYVGLSQASTTDTWTYKQGGSAGTTLRTIVITYTDSTKATISNVALS